MNPRAVAALAVAAMVAAGVENPLPPSAQGNGCRHIGNNKSPFLAEQRHARKRFAKQSRRRNRKA